MISLKKNTTDVQPLYWIPLEYVINLLILKGVIQMLSFVRRENRFAIIVEDLSVIEDLMTVAETCMVVQLNRFTFEIGPLRPYRGDFDALQFMINGTKVMNAEEILTIRNLSAYPRMNFVPDESSIIKQYQEQAVFRYLIDNGYTEVNERQFHLNLIKK